MKIGVVADLAVPLEVAALLFGLSVPAWLSAKLYNKFFRKLEDQINAAKPAQDAEEAGEDERIFRDELDESLAGDTEVQ